MVSMIDGCFKWRGPGPALLFLLTSLATYSTASTPAPSRGLGPAVYLTVHLSEGVTKVKLVGVGGGADGGWQGVCAVPLRDVPCGTVPGCAVGRRDRASPVD